MALVCAWALDPAAAQNKVQFGGAGRLLLDNAGIDGTLLEDDNEFQTDTTTARREMGGSALFDLGVTIRPDENTEILAITRVQNDIDGFWGAGIVFELRQLTAKGVIADAVRYGIGDIDVALTPYTFWNNASEFRIGQTPAFDAFRDILDYENFYADSAWRQQGLEAEWGLEFSRGIQGLRFRGMIAKNRQTDFFTLPDRLMAMGQIGIHVNESLQFNLNATNLFDVSESAQFNTEESATRVISLSGSTGGESDKLLWRVDAEGGASSVVFTDIAEAPVDNIEDFFIDVRGTVELPEPRLNFQLGFVDVGADFRSPAAQSRRLDINAPAQQFGFYTNREIQRPLNIRDVLLDPLVYERTISPGLQAFLPSWDNVRPYGIATPNRRGFDLAANWKGDTAGQFEAGLQAALLTEIRGEGTEEKRQFVDLRLQAAWHLNKTIGWEKDLSFHVAGRYQTTSRDGSPEVSEVSLNSTIAEAGITVELIDQLDLMAGLMWYSAEGNEFLADRDAFNQVDFFTAYNVDASEWFGSAGLRYRFNESINLSLQMQSFSQTDALSPQTDYNIRNILLLYNMFF
jgi:hypothetical protein